MKLHQHQNPETIFFIHPPTDAMEAAVHVAFDDVEAAKSYINRFKTFSDAEIVECRLNPVFYADISNDCYFVQLNKYDDGYAIDLVDDLQRSELARDGYYFFEEDQICIYLMAGSENGAFNAARKIRDQVMANHKAYGYNSAIFRPEEPGLKGLTELRGNTYLRSASSLPYWCVIPMRYL